MPHLDLRWQVEFQDRKFTTTLSETNLIKLLLEHSWRDNFMFSLRTLRFSLYKQTVQM